jgi:hypothetical protein
LPIAALSATPETVLTGIDRVVNHSTFFLNDHPSIWLLLSVPIASLCLGQDCIVSPAGCCGWRIGYDDDTAVDLTTI